MQEDRGGHIDSRLNGSSFSPYLNTSLWRETSCLDFWGSLDLILLRKSILNAIFKKRKCHKTKQVDKLEIIVHCICREQNIPLT